MRQLMFVILLFVPLAVHGNTMGPVTAKVIGTGTYDDGSIYIFFDRTISTCRTEGRIDLAAEHPAKEQVLSIAMTAFVSGKSVRIQAGSCVGDNPKFGTVGDSYFYLTNENS